LGRISDKKSRNIAQEKEQRRGQKKEYALVFVDQTDFVMQEMMKGYDKLYKKCHMLLEKMIKNEEEVKPVTEHEKSLAGQMKLPMFPYITKNFSLH
jgi:hypothetical protein